MDAGVGSAKQSAGQNSRSRHHKPSPRTPGEPSGSEHTQSSRRKRYPRRSDDSSPAPVQSTRNTQTAAEKPRSFRQSHRGAKFNAALTEPSTSQPVSTTESRKGNAVEPKGDDLASTLIHALSTPPYSDCPICFNVIRPDHSTWSCSPSSPSSYKSDLNSTTQCCWTTFHLHCIRSWSIKSVKEVADAWQARGEARPGQWRCPGCQLRREIVPSGYRCFCGSTPGPKLTRLATPHSCGNPCSRSRPCGHPCPLSCHPGPCPPCQIMVQRPCSCGVQTLLFKCFSLNKDNVSLSCGNTCGKELSCGNHACAKTCHEGVCEPCKVKQEVRCYCGKVWKEVECGEGTEKHCVIEGEETWVGRFECTNECGQPFECGVHFCTKACHPPSPTPILCSYSPSLITHCPCGKHELNLPTSQRFFPPDVLLQRTKCTDPVPTCTSKCSKLLPGCAHPCPSECHPGSCPPCTNTIMRPCRCGMSTFEVSCLSYQNSVYDTNDDNVLCDRLCQVLRACGKHHCNRICCPLASLAPAKGKGVKRALAMAKASTIDERGLHECDLICGRLLGCGNHRCEDRDHRGACPPCFRSSFEELVCHCGGTILDPPIPCGTRVNCAYQCSRDPPPCGHPRTQHTCHEDSTPCPPCPFLTRKECLCKKKVLDNIKCSQEKVLCGTPCGKLLDCGFHHCERLCHKDECGACTSICGKSRKLCLPDHHPCTDPCHAPSACSEDIPCRSHIELTCPCGRLKRAVSCARSAANPSGRATLTSQQIQCTNDCLIAKRNARLAEALGVNPQGQQRTVAYSNDLTTFARANAKFSSLVEKTLGDFVNSEKKMQVLPHMSLDQRKFVQDLAFIYRLDTQLIDQEPHRSVQIIRRIDTRIPTPLLSSTVTPLTHVPAELGRLVVVDMRHAPRHSSTPPPRTQTAQTSSSIPDGPGSWRAVVKNASNSVQLPLENIVQVQSTSPGLKDANRGSGAAQPTSESSTPKAPAEGSNIPDSWEDDV